MLKVNNKGSFYALAKAVIISIFGTTISGIVACNGSCTTMYMDFCRSFIETLTTIVSFIIFLKINSNNSYKNTRANERIRIITGIVMMCTSILLMTVSIMSFNPKQVQENNIPSLITTSICVFINLSILRNYKKELSTKFDHIIKAQYTMYKSKTTVNSFVLLILVLVNFAPTWSLISYIDLVGTFCMSIFIFSEGVKNASITSKSVDTVVCED